MERDERETHGNSARSLCCAGLVQLFGCGIRPFRRLFGRLFVLAEICDRFVGEVETVGREDGLGHVEGLCYVVHVRFATLS